MLIGELAQTKKGRPTGYLFSSQRFSTLYPLSHSTPSNFAARKPTELNSTQQQESQGPLAFEFDVLLAFGSILAAQASLLLYV